MLVIDNDTREYDIYNVMLIIVISVFIAVLPIYIETDLMIRQCIHFGCYDNVMIMINDNAVWCWRNDIHSMEKKWYGVYVPINTLWSV